MTDKDVQRNVRSSSEEGVQTPTQKHYRTLSEKNNIPGENRQKKAQKESLLAKFREREKKRRRKGKKDKAASIESRSKEAENKARKLAKDKLPNEKESQK